MNREKIFLIFKAAALLIFVSVPLYVKFAVFEKTVIASADSIAFSIPRNSSLTSIAIILKEKGFDLSPAEFRLTSKWYGLDGKIRYGDFVHHGHGKTSLRELIEFLTRKGTVTVNVTVPEGSGIKDIAGILKAEMGIDSASFVEMTRNADLLEEYSVDGRDFEGYLYPETYNFNRSDTEKDIIRRMAGTARKMIREVQDQIDSSGFSEKEIITLASIIQGEVMDYSEAEKISAVYNNRLRKGILLQADPTVQYILGKPKRLLYKDISIDDPYNTYIYKGLPPGPINNPSLRTIKAALNPSEEKYLYMVAKGDGTHYFNYTLEEHLIDKEKLDVLRKELRKKKK